MPDRRRRVGQKIDYWTRGLHFTWIWSDLGLEWHGYEQFLFFRGTREWYLVYIPFFWRSFEEFLKFEEEFIQKATAPRGTMSEAEFIRRAESFKAKLQLSAIQGPLLGAVGAGGGAAATVAGGLEKINKAEEILNKAKCLKGDEEACASVIGGWATGKAQKAIGK